MSPREHRQVALDFLAASDQEFERGDVLQGAEKLWGAAAHSIMSIAQEREWPHESHRSLKNAAERIAEEYDDPLIAGYFSVAEKFHRHFYHDSTEDWERGRRQAKSPRPRSESVGVAPPADTSSFRRGQGEAPPHCKAEGNAT